MGRRSKDPHELIPSENKGQARVYYRGRWHHLGPWDARKNCPSDEAARKLETLRAIWRSDPTAFAVRPSSGLMAVAWVEWGLSPEAPRGQPSEFKKVTELLFGDETAPGPHFLTHIDDFTPGHLMEFQSRLVALKLVRSTVASRIRLVKRFFGWAVAKGLVSPAEVAALNMIPPPQGVAENGQRGIATLEEVEILASKMRGEAGGLFLVQALTGARPSELSRLTAGMIQQSGQWRSRKGIVLDLGKLGVWCADLETHKTAGKGIQRVLFFGSRAQSLLTPKLKRGGLLFRTRAGKPYNANSLETICRKSCERRHLRHFSPYEIRHGVAAKIQQEYGQDTPGLGFLAAQAVLGHAVKGVTARYTGIDYSSAAKVIAQIG